MSFRPNKISDDISFKSNESLFHSTATACENERLPKLERNLGTGKLKKYWDLVTIVFRFISSDKYSRSLPGWFIKRCAYKRILKIMRCLIGNQCSCFRYDEVGVEVENRKIERAAEFIIRCSFSNKKFGRP